MAILPKATYISSAITMTTTISFLTETEKKYPKIHMESQKILDNQTMLSKTNNAGRITTPDLKDHYRAITIKTIW